MIMANVRDNFVKAAQKYIGAGCTVFNNFFGMPPGTAWCAEFVSKCASDVGLINKCFVKTMGAGDIPRYGVEKGFGKWLEGYESIPQPGDVIVFTWNGLEYYPGYDKYFSDHVGIVEYVEGNTVHTIEGNANGTNISSTVCRKSYPIYSGKINGYFRPNWSLADPTYSETTTNTTVSLDDKKKAIKEVQLWHNRKFGTTCDVDGEYGPKTKAAIVCSLQCYLNSTYKSGLDTDGIMGAKTKAACRLLKKGDTGDYVKILQSILICRGYDTKGYDGEFGEQTKIAVTDFQKKSSLSADGIAGPDTFYSLLI